MPMTDALAPAPIAAAPARPAATRLRAALVRFAAVVALLAAPGLAPAPATAQSPFSPAVWVNDSAITNYEIEQRRRFLNFIGAGGADARERAIERLIEDRLQMQEARRLGLRLAPDQLNRGMAEFAARAELTVDEMLARMRREGIDRETFVEFIRAGLFWRDLVQARFGPEVRITEAQVERAISIENVRPVPEVLISEIFLPTDPQFAEIVQQIIPQVLAIRTVEEFGQAARAVSVAPTGEQGGRVANWIPLGGVPEPLQSLLRDAVVGRVLGPVEVPGALGFFMLRARREVRDVPPGQTELQFRRALLPGGRSPGNDARVARIRSLAQHCPDFGAAVGAVAPELGTQAVETVTALVPELPAGVATELARLNPGDVSANLVEGGNLVVVQLCARRLVPDPRPSPAQVRELLFNRALEQRAEVYLQTLRAEAEIRRN